MTTLQIKMLSNTAKLPVRASPGAAGYDLFSTDHCVVPAHGRVLVSTGLAIRVPEGCYGRIAPRSGLAVKHGIDVGAGVIDQDYRGEVHVLLFNTGDDSYTVSVGDRIAQLILEQIVTPETQLVGVLDETARGAGGFGSTGASTVAAKSPADTREYLEALAQMGPLA